MSCTNKVQNCFIHLVIIVMSIYMTDRGRCSWSESVNKRAVYVHLSLSVSDTLAKHPSSLALVGTIYLMSFTCLRLNNYSYLLS
jgi:hypothetical protein